MDNLFSTSETEETNLFSAVPPPPEAPVNQAPEDAARTARLAAVAAVSPEAADILEQLNAETEKNEARIRQYGEHVLRREVAVNDQAARVKSLAALAIDPAVEPEVQRGAQLAASTALAEDIDKRAQYALEQQAIKSIQNLAAAGDYTQAKVIARNAIVGGAEDVITDTNTKLLILRREVERAAAEAKDRPWYAKTFDFIAGDLVGSLLLNSSLSNRNNVEAPGVKRDLTDALLSGRRKRDEAAALWSMPVEEFTDYVQGDLLNNVRENSTFLGWRNKGEESRLLAGILDTPSVLETNFWDATNLAFMAPIGALGKATSVPGLMVRNGARKQAAQLYAEAANTLARGGAEAATRQTGLSPDEVVDGLLPTLVNPSPTPGVSTVPVATEAAEMQARGQQLLQELVDIQQPGRFANTAEMQDAIRKTVDRIQTDFDRPLKDVSGETVTLADNSKVYQLNFMLGNKKGGGYSSEKSAQRAATGLGLNADNVIQDESGQWFIKTSRTMAETGFYNTAVRPNSTSPIGRFLLSSRSVGDDMLNDMGQIALDTRAKMVGGVLKELSRTVNRLGGDQRENLAHIMVEGERRGVWFTPGEIDMLTERTLGRAATRSEQEAYQAARNYNDISYALANDARYKELALKGYQSVDLLDDKNVTALVSREWVDVPRTRVYNASDGIHYHNAKPMTVDEAARLQQQGYVMVKTAQPVKLKDGVTVDQFVIKGNDLVVNPLNRIQLAYRAGGNRYYKGRYFAKQAVKGVQPDTGKEFLANPATYRVFETKAQADEWTGVMEEARLAYLNDDLDRVHEILEGRRGFPDGDEFIKGMEDGSFEKATPFRGVFDRDPLPEYTESSDALRFIDEEETGFNGYLRTNGRMIYSKKGETLRDYEGDFAETIDPFEAINRSLRSVANMSSFSDYKISAVERWVNTFRPLLDTASFNQDGSLAYIFNNARFKPSLTPEQRKLVEGALGQREIIQRTLGWRDENARKADLLARQISEWVIGDDPSSLRHAVGQKMVGWWEDKNPINAARKLASDMKLGMLNVAQFPLQIGTAMAAMTLRPDMAMQGMASMLPMRHYLRRVGGEADLNFFVERGVHGLMGFDDVAEFKEYMRYAKNSGRFEVAHSQTMINAHGASASLSGLGNRWNDAMEGMRFFFDEAERVNRIMAYRIGWDEAVKRFGKSKIGSDEFKRFLSGRAEDYSFRMSNASAAVWQKGILSVPTQFWSYHARMLEAMLGKQFTVSQRVRLALGQSIFFGSAGLPGIAWVADEMKKRGNGAPDLESLWGIADRGIVDLIVNKMTGADVIVGGRYGSGQFWSDTFKDIVGIGEYGPVSFAEIATGASGSILAQTGKTFYDLIKYSAAESGSELEGSLTEENLKKLAGNISSVSNAMKGYMAFKYGTFMTAKGGTTLSGIDPQTSALITLGFQPGEVDEVSAMMGYNKHKNKMVKEAAKVITNYRTRMVNEPENRDEIEQNINLFLSLQDPEVARLARKKANRDVDASLYDSLVEQREKEENRKYIRETVSGESDR